MITWEFDDFSFVVNVFVLSLQIKRVCCRLNAFDDDKNNIWQAASLKRVVEK